MGAVKGGCMPGTERTSASMEQWLKTRMVMGALKGGCMPRREWMGKMGHRLQHLLQQMSPAFGRQSKTVALLMHGHGWLTSTLQLPMQLLMLLLGRIHRGPTTCNRLLSRIRPALASKLLGKTKSLSEVLKHVISLLM